jgi:hypothetical protein
VQFGRPLRESERAVGIGAEHLRLGFGVCLADPLPKLPLDRTDYGAVSSNATFRQVYRGAPFARMQ